MANELVVHSGGQGGAPSIFDPGRFELMMRMAESMARCSMLPKSITHTKQGQNEVALPEATVLANALMCVDLAMRWEMSPFVTSQHIAFVHGKLVVEGKLCAAVIEARLGCRLHYVFNGKPGNQLGVRVFATIPGEAEPREIEGTVADWHRGDKSPWAQPGNWQRMLRYRGAREWGRAHAPAVMLGVYTADDVEGEEDLGPAVDLTADIPDEVKPPALMAPTADQAELEATRETLRSDAAFLSAFDTDLATAKTLDDLASHVEANREAIGERGLEQQANDVHERHLARVNKALAAAAKAAKPKADAKPAAAPKAEAAAKAPPKPKTPEQIKAEETYAAIGKAMRWIEAQHDSTLKELAGEWNARQADLKTLPERWRKELEADKDRIKAVLQAREEAAKAKAAAPADPPGDDDLDPPTLDL